MFDFNLQWLLHPTLSFVRRELSLPLALNELKLVENTLTFLLFFLKEFERVYGKDFGKDFKARILDICLFVVLWGVGGVLEPSSRNKLNLFLLKMIYLEDVRETYNLDFEMEGWEKRGYSVNIGDCKNLFNIRFNLETKKWSSWGEEEFRADLFKNHQYEDLIVPTQDSQRNAYFVRGMAYYKINVMLTGLTGTGKSVGIRNVLERHFSGADHASYSINFSGQTNTNALQRQIEMRMNSRRGKKGVFGPFDNKKQMIIFIDDFNMPSKEVYGAQPPIELLRMWMDHGFWYNLETLD